MSADRQAVHREAGQSTYTRWQLPQVQADQEGNTPLAKLTAAELEALQRRAYDEGFAAGHRDGFVEGQRQGLEAAAGQSRCQVERLQGLLQCLVEPLNLLDAEVESSLVSLAIAIARQVVRREVQTHPEQIRSVVREALGILPVAVRNIRLYLHPDDARLVVESLTAEQGKHQWTILEDPTLSPGGCRVASDTAQVDASLEQRLAAVIAHLLKEQDE